MPRVINQKTGEVKWVPEDAVQKYLNSGYSLPETVRMIGPSGGTFSVPLSEAEDRIRQGYNLESDEEFFQKRKAAHRAEQPSGFDDYVAAIAAGVARGASMGGSDYALKQLGRLVGNDPEMTKSVLRELQENYSTTSAVSELIGAVGPALASGGTGALGTAARATPAGQLGRVAGVVEKGLARRAKQDMFIAGAEGAAKAVKAGEVIGGPVRGATTLGLVSEGAAFGAAQGVSNIPLSNDPLTAESVINEIGMGALYGGMFGGAIGVVGGGARSLLKRSARRAKTEIAAYEAIEEIEKRGAEVRRLDAEYKAAKIARNEQIAVDKSIKRNTKKRFQEELDSELEAYYKENAGVKATIRNISAARKQFKNIHNHGIDDFPRRLELSQAGSGLRARVAEKIEKGAIKPTDELIEILKASQKAEDDFVEIAKRAGLYADNVKYKQFLDGQLSVPKSLRISVKAKKDIQKILDLDDLTLKQLRAAAAKMEDGNTAILKAVRYNPEKADTWQQLMSTSRKADEMLEGLFKGKLSKPLPEHMRWQELQDSIEKSIKSGFGDVDRSAFLAPYAIKTPVARGGLAEIFENAMIYKKGDELFGLPKLPPKPKMKKAPGLPERPEVPKPELPSEVELNAEVEAIIERISKKHGIDMTRHQKALEAVKSAAKKGLTYHVWSEVGKGGLGATGAIKGALAARLAGFAIEKASGPVLRLLGGYNPASATAASLRRTRSRIGKIVDRILESKGAKTRRAASISASKILNSVRFGNQDGDITKEWPNFNRYSELQRSAANPGGVESGMRELFQDFSYDDPVFTEQAIQLGMGMMNLLIQRMPMGPEKMAFSNRRYPPSDTEISRWANMVHALQEPEWFWDRLARGCARLEEVEIVRLAYPNMFAQVQNNLMARAMEIRANLPYKTVVNLSMKLNIPGLHPLTTQKAIFDAQTRFMPPPMGGPPRPPPPSMRQTIEEYIETPAQNITNK